MNGENETNYLSYMRQKHNANEKQNVTIGLICIIWISTAAMIAFLVIEKYVLTTLLVAINFVILFLWITNKSCYMRVLLTISSLYAIIGLMFFVLTIDFYIRNQQWGMIVFGIVALAVQITGERITIYKRIKKNQYETINCKKDQLPGWLSLCTGATGMIIARLMGIIAGNNIVIQLFIPLLLSFSGFLLCFAIRYVHIFLLEKTRLT